MKPLRKITGPVMLSGTGQVGAFDKDEQVPELQKLSWPLMFAEKATEAGFDVDGLEVEVLDRHIKIRLLWIEEVERWTWEVLP